MKVGRACWTSERSFESKGWSRRTGQRRSGRDPEAVEPGRKDVGIRRLRRTITGCEDLQTIYKSDGSIDDFGLINQAKTGIAGKWPSQLPSRTFCMLTPAGTRTELLQLTAKFTE